ncbi:hypothetical protein GCM10010390_07060 [Streptomyces mordarskii]|uniref:Uncharacterized protein n=1 Tax=Streptomyces mordarskii TaxID=1226758 RepID=A0ABN1BWE0_9ACTN
MRGALGPGDGWYAEVGALVRELGKDADLPQVPARSGAHGDEPVQGAVLVLDDGAGLFTEEFQRAFADGWGGSDGVPPFACG